MNGKLVVKQAWGRGSIVKNALIFSAPNNLAYISGHQVAVLNTESKEQNFISGTNTYQHQSQGFTAIGTSHTKKLLAVAEKVEPVAIITFYDSVTLRRKKTFTLPEIGSNEIRSIAFSDDGKYMATQGAGPEWNLVLWNVDKISKSICYSKISLSDENAVQKISFCPADPNVILVIGKAILRLFRYSEGQLRPMTITMRQNQANFISYCWLDGGENLLVGTETGEVLIIENFEVRGHIAPGRDEQDGDSYPIHCLLPTPRGFLMGSLNGELKLFEKRDDSKEKFVLEATFYIPGDHGHVLEFALGGEDLLVCGTDRQQLISCSLGSLNAPKDDKESDPTKLFDHIFTPFHASNGKGECEITGIDVAVWKQVVVTCGRDRTVKVWNPAERRMELSQEFDEEPMGISVHPSGIYIAVIFQDKIHVLSILLEKISLCREIAARQVSYIKFSRGGQYIAASVGTHLQIFQTYTGLPVATLRGHSNRVRSVTWLNFDSRIITVGSEGVIHCWDLFPVVKRHEHYPGTIPIAAGIASQDGSRVFIASNDRLIKELNFASASDVVASLPSHGATATSNLAPEGIVKIMKSIELPEYVTSMAFDDSRKLLVMGNSADAGPSGLVVTMTVPIIGGGSQTSTPTIEDNFIHSSPITAICMSHDGSTIYSGDMQGCIIVSEFENAATRADKHREGTFSFDFLDEVVIHKSDLDNRKNQIDQLSQSVEELNQNNEHQMRVKEMEHKDRLKEITDKFMMQLKAERVKYDDLESEKKEIEKEFGRKVKALEQKHIDELKNIEFKYKTKHNAEENRHKMLVEETENAHRRWNEENEVLIQSHQRYLQELSRDYESRMVGEQSSQNVIHQQKEKLSVHFDVLKNETEFDGDREVAEIKIRFDAQLKMEEEAKQQLSGQHGTLEKSLQGLKKDEEQQVIEIKRLKDKEGRYHETITTLEKDIQSHKKEIREREETITDKEKRIYELKKKNQELEKFRFVLDYKIKELKLQIAPRENEINTMSKQIEEMNLELEQYDKSNRALNLMVDELKLKMEGIRTELEGQNERSAISERFLDKFRRDLQALWLLRSDNNAFKNALIKMYRIYVQEDVSPATMGENSKGQDMEDPQQVYNRDREQMERSLDSLRRAMKTEALAHRRDMGKMMRESVLLTKELNMLRKNARGLQLQKKAIDQAGELTVQANLQRLIEVLNLQVKSNKPNPPKEQNQQEIGLEDSQEQGSNVAGDNAYPPKPGGGNSARVKRPTVVSRSAALRTVSAEGVVSRGGEKTQSRQDQWEAWREIQIQYDQMKNLEERIAEVCSSLGLDHNPLIVAVDSKIGF